MAERDVYELTITFEECDPVKAHLVAADLVERARDTMTAAKLHRPMLVTSLSRTRTIVSTELLAEPVQDRGVIEDMVAAGADFNAAD